MKFFKEKAVVFAVLVAVILVYSAPGCVEQERQHTAASRQRFDDIELWVRIFEDPERDKWQKPDEVVEHLNLKNGHIIADIGAGTGYFTRRFARVVGPDGKALGLDVEPNMVKYMKEDALKLNLQNYVARVVKPDDPELEPHSVDVVFMCNTYHHIEDRINYLKRLAESLRADSRVVIVDFYKKPLPFGPPVDHKMAKKTVLKEFKLAGYHLKRSLKILPYQYFLEFGL